MLVIGGHSVEEIGRLTLWDYGAAMYEWAARQPERDEIKAPTADEYWADVEELKARNDPRIRLQ